MPTKNYSIVNSGSIPGTGASGTIGPFTVGNALGVSISGKITNGATAPTVPFSMIIEYRYFSDQTYTGISIVGSIANNDIVPFNNVRIPKEAYDWRIFYTEGSDQAVTLLVNEGRYTP